MLRRSTPPVPKLDIADLKRRIAQADAQLAERFWQGADVVGLVSERSRFIDAFLAEVWQHFFRLDSSGIALVAVGGYGRGELHPYSDIDLLILARRPHAHREHIEAFLRLLWDLKLDIGHSVRTLGDCKREAQRDLTVATTLMERRHLAGAATLSAKLDKLFKRSSTWPSDAFYSAKKEEQLVRHAQYDDVDYDLEPNIKGSPGGLRDIQTISWIAERHFGTADTDTLIPEGFLTERESNWLVEGRRFLWHVRFGLHLIAGRKEDRLLFDFQRELAARFGYEDTEAQLAVEQFMGDYYRRVLVLREVNDIILQHFDEIILQAKRRPSIEPINERFQRHNNYIEVTSDDVFAKDPATIMEMFLLMSTIEGIEGVRASTIRLVRDNLDLIDESFRSDERVTAQFLALLRAPFTLVSQLTRMRRYGVLGRYIPAFGEIIGQMQHDLFHIYTVDAHTMMVIQQMRRLRFEANSDRFPVATTVVQRLPKIELLYLAGLFHDIGKGRGGDHSTLGAEDARTFCRQHGLSVADSELVGWLVQNHLVMSTTAQRKDIADPDVINEFAELVVTRERLDYLYVLTVADINATNPTLWNSWRATLMRQLYHQTRIALDEGAQRTRGAVIAARKDESRAMLAAEAFDAGVIEEIWSAVDESFFLHHDAAQIAELTRHIGSHDLDEGPLVVLLDLGDAVREDGATEIVVYTRDRSHLFAISVAALDSVGLLILGAFISTHGDIVVNSFIVLSENGDPLGADDKTRDRVAAVVADSIQTNEPRDPVSRRLSRRLRQFASPTEVSLTNDAEKTSTLSVVASDRPGLLATLGRIFVELDLSVRQANITTLGERVEDVFQIADRDGARIENESSISRITATIKDRVDSEISDAA